MYSNFKDKAIGMRFGPLEYFVTTGASTRCFAPWITEVQLLHIMSLNVSCMRCADYVKEAVEEDNAGNYPKAFELYKIALDYFSTHLKYEKNPRAKEAITAKVSAHTWRSQSPRFPILRCLNGAHSTLLVISWLSTLLDALTGRARFEPLRWAGF